METVLTAVASKAVGSIFDNMMGTEKGNNSPAAAASAPAAPAVEPVTAMPTPNDAAVAAARRKSIAGLVARQGRAASILTDQSSNGAALGA